MTATFAATTTSLDAPDLGNYGFRCRVEISDPRMDVQPGDVLTFSTAFETVEDGELVIVQARDVRNELGRVDGPRVIVAGREKPVRLDRAILLGVAVERSRLMRAR